jgi:hypothetical protein
MKRNKDKKLRIAGNSSKNGSKRTLNKFFLPSLRGKINNYQVTSQVVDFFLVWYNDLLFFWAWRHPDNMRRNNGVTR